jgi:hypothetical protein
VIDNVPPNSPLFEKVPESLLRQTSYREFLDEAVAYGMDAIQQFRSLRDAALGAGA